MKKSILEIYALAVCFVTIICFAVALGIATYDIIKIQNPSFTLDDYNYRQYQSNDNYCAYNNMAKSPACSKGNQKEITATRESAYENALVNEKRSGLQSLVNCLIVILIDLLVFIAHWIIARRARGL